MRKSKPKLGKKTDEKYDPRDWDESSVTEVIPEPRMKTGLSTSIRLPASMVNKLRKIAAKKGDIGYQTLIKIWIAERLEEESIKKTV
ncbi:MAG: CopG family antitoxin [Proteobacteria bacterium]|nr:CopG family antitoxin [Pseudomonadota bacterium]